MLLVLASFFLLTHIHSRIGYLTGAGSDYAAFVHYLGITSLDMSYTYDRVGKKWWRLVFVACVSSCHANVSFRLKPTLGSTRPTTRRTTPSITAPGSSIPVGDGAPRLTLAKAASGSSRVCVLASGFLSHQAVARTAGNILIRLADSLVLPLNYSDYSESLEDYLNTAMDQYEAKLQTVKISMGNPPDTP